MSISVVPFSAGTARALELFRNRLVSSEGVSQPVEGRGHEMTRLLVARIGSAQRAPRRVILATELVVRESSAG